MRLYLYENTCPMTDRVITDEVLRFLHRNVGLFYCRSCIASLAKISLREVQNAWPDLAIERTIDLSEGHCDECRNVRTVVRAKRVTA